MVEEEGVWQTEGSGRGKVWVAPGQVGEVPFLQGGQQGQRFLQQGLVSAIPSPAHIQDPEMACLHGGWKEGRPLAYKSRSDKSLAPSLSTYSNLCMQVLVAIGYCGRHEKWIYEGKRDIWHKSDWGGRKNGAEKSASSYDCHLIACDLWQITTVHPSLHFLICKMGEKKHHNIPQTANVNIKRDGMTMLLQKLNAMFLHEDGLLSSDEWIKKMWYIQAKEYHSVVERGEILT